MFGSPQGGDVRIIYNPGKNKSQSLGRVGLTDMLNQSTVQKDDKGTDSNKSFIKRLHKRNVSIDALGGAGGNLRSRRALHLPNVSVEKLPSVHAGMHVDRAAPAVTSRGDNGSQNRVRPRRNLNQQGASTQIGDASTNQDSQSRLLAVNTRL